MKKIFFAVICFLSLALIDIHPTSVLAACNMTPAPSPPADCCGTGSTVGCGAIGSGQVLTIVVYPYDNEGNPIKGVTVNYAWSITTPAAPNQSGLGTLSVTAANQSNTLGNSYAQLTASSSASGINGVVKVIASYGGVSATKTFTMNAICTADPKLYYGIGGVKDNGDDNWQYSTAELLETCKTEYKLFEGTGERY